MNLLSAHRFSSFLISRENYIQTYTHTKRHIHDPTIALPPSVNYFIYSPKEYVQTFFFSLLQRVSEQPLEHICMKCHISLRQQCGRKD